MKQALRYSIRVWLTAVVIGPVVTAIVGMLFLHNQFNDFNSVFGFITYSIPFGLLLSVLSWLLLLLSAMLISLTKMNIVREKIALSILGCIFTLLPFYLVFSNDDNAWTLSHVLWAMSYCVVVVGGIWFYKLQPVPDIAEFKTDCD